MITGIQAQFNDEFVRLNNFHEEIVVRIRARPNESNILVTGKVVITNSDGDPQNASVRLTFQDGFNETDTTTVRIPGGGSQVVSVIGWVRGQDVIAGQFVDLRVSTFNGVTQKARLVVMGADNIGSTEA